MLRSDNIAILMAVFNGEKYIAEQIESLLAQTYGQWELFIHDDGSTDCTLSIIQSFVNRYPERIHIVDGEPRGGAKDNFFFLMRQVQAPYVMFCDQDDVWLPEKVETSFRRMKSMEERSGPDVPLLVFSDLTVTDSNLEIVSERLSVYQKLYPERTAVKDLMIQNVITGCTVMINRALAELAVRPERTDMIIMHDWWCALLAAYFGKISFVDASLMLYRQHGDNSVGAKALNSGRYIKNRIKNHRVIYTSLLATQRQASFFTRAYAISDPVLYGYGNLYERNKLRRMWFYAKHHVHKCGWQRNLGLLIWG